MGGPGALRALREVPSRCVWLLLFVPTLMASRRTIAALKQRLGIR